MSNAAITRARADRYAALLRHALDMLAKGDPDALRDAADAVGSGTSRFLRELPEDAVVGNEGVTIYLEALPTLPAICRQFCDGVTPHSELVTSVEKTLGATQGFISALGAQ